MDSIRYYDSPIGRITMASDGEAIIGLWLEGQRYYADTLVGTPEEAELPVFEEACRWLDAYFAGETLPQLPALAPRGTAYRRAVWDVLRRIPYGETMSYGEVAHRAAESLGRKGASARAAGGAVGHNPISIMIPCHRVVGTDGSLTGYAGGIDAKQRLLSMEQNSLRGKVRAVFIDIDNTLLDFDEYVRQTMRTGFAHFGIRDYEPRMYDVFLKINTGLWRQIERGELDFEELQKIRWNRIFEALDIVYDGPTFETYFREALFTSAILVEGAADTVKYLSEKYMVCAASNGPEAQQINRLKEAGLYPMFTEVYVSETVGASKPSPAFFEEALSRLNRKLSGQGETRLSFDQVLMVGDSLTSDMDGGIAAGMKTCYFHRGESAPDRKGRRVDAVISSLKELRTIL